MSRSSLLPSSIGESDPQSRIPETPPSANGRPARRTLAIRFAALIRWLHIYLSMFGLASVLFFSVTGLTLNHPDWFFAGAERSVQAEGRMDPKWLRGGATAAPSGLPQESDPAGQVAKLEVVEYLRTAHGVRGALADFQVDETQCVVSFKSPGYAADAFIDRASGRYDVTQTYQGVVAVRNDLHKGRDSGFVWSVLIDVSAVVLTLIALTGLVLLFYLKLRRGPGLVVILIGTAAVVAVFLLGVP
jgi:uncharacterized protein